MDSLEKRYARVFVSARNGNVKKLGRDEALKLWLRHKAEWVKLRGDNLMNRVINGMKKL